jgi:predicted Zn-dependent peptidase
MKFKEFKDFQFKNNLSMNAFTGPVEMGLTGSGHFSDQEKLVQTTLQMAFEPIFDQEVLDQEKEIVLKEISERSGQPSYRLHFEVMGEILEPNSFENHQVLGSSKQVKKTKIPDFQRLMDQNLNQSHLLFLVSGKNIDTNNIKSQIEKYLPKLDNKIEKEDLDYYPGTFFKDFKTKVVVSKLAHEHVDLTLYIPLKTTFEQKPVARVFEELFLRYHGKIYNQLRDEMGLIYSMSGEIDYLAGSLIISMSCEIEDVEKIVMEIKTCLSDFEKNFDQEKFDWLKAIMSKKLAISKDNLSEESNFLYDQLTTYNQVYTLDKYIEDIEKVTVSELQNLYQQIQVNLDKTRFILVSNQKSVSKYENFYW